MFLGHFGLAFAAKKVAPKVSVGTTLVACYLGAAFGPPPPNTHALALTSLAGYLMVAWGWWIDRHRAPAGISPGG